MLVSKTTSYWVSLEFFKNLFLSNLYLWQNNQLIFMIDLFGGRPVKIHVCFFIEFLYSDFHSSLLII
jgi:hypothetical protein